MIRRDCLEIDRGQHLSFHLPILLAGYNEWKTKHGGKAKQRGLVGVLLKVRQEWEKQEGVETDDAS